MNVTETTTSNLTDEDKKYLIERFKKRAKIELLIYKAIMYGLFLIGLYYILNN